MLGRSKFSPAIAMWTCGILVMLGMVFGVLRTASAQTRLPTPTVQFLNVARSAISAADVITPEVKLVTGDIQLWGVITLQIDHLSEYIEKTEKDPQTLVPFLNGKQLKGTHPILIDLQSNQVQFHLTRSNDNKDVWDGIIKSYVSSGNVWSTKRKINISAGFEDERQFRTSNQQLFFVIASPSWIFISILGSLAVFLGLLYFCFRTNLIRTSPISPTIQDITSDDGRSPKLAYSLGLTQMIWWFLIIFVCYVFINLVTWNINVITESSLVLLGISAATALGSVAITNSKQDEDEIKKLKDEWIQLQKTIRDRKDKIDTGIDAEKNKQLLKKDISKLKQVRKKLQFSNGFLDDILTDVNGASLHRYQIVVWTILLGGIFFVSSVVNLALPEFNAVLLALIGISSTTYLGFKFPEPSPVSGPK